MREHKERKICLALLGPTCSGKSELALRLAERLGGEIVSCDSMQVYRGLDVGTAKPDRRQRERIPHHLVDIIDISERYDAHLFVQDASRAISLIAARGRVPILAGGTGLYAKCLIYGRRLPEADRDLHSELLALSETPAGREELRRQIARYSVSLADRIHDNPRRLARAVELLRISGTPSPGEEFRFDHKPRTGFLQFIFYPPPSEHRQRIACRTRQMLETGWIEEVRSLQKSGFLRTPTARQALGYRTIAEFLDSDGGHDIARLEAQLISQTWAYARRQRTWFRHQHPGALQIPLQQGVGMEAQLAAVLSRL